MTKQSLRLSINSGFSIELEEGKHTDWERLKDITIGVLTVREIEPLDQTLSELLYQVVDEVTRIQSHRRSKSGF